MNPTSISEYDIRQLKADGDLNAYLHQAVADARAICARRRALVLAHHDLAERLTQPPASFTRPDCWTGYIPPETCHGRPNTSPVRAQLLQVVAEAQSRRAS